MPRGDLSRTGVTSPWRCLVSCESSLSERSRGAQSRSKIRSCRSVRGMGANILANRQTVSPRLPSEPSLQDGKKRAGSTDQRRRTGSCKTSPQFYWRPSYRSNLLSISRCSELGIPAPYGRNIAPMRIYHRRGRLIGEGQERVARASPSPGDVGVSPTTKTPLVLARRRGARSKTTQGEGMRSTRSWIWHR